MRAMHTGLPLNDNTMRMLDSVGYLPSVPTPFLCATGVDLFLPDLRLVATNDAILVEFSQLGTQVAFYYTLAKI